jgi:hypothetical protein
MIILIEESFMRTRLALVLLITLSALLLPHTGRAQDEIHLDNLEINLWPEYDASDMLVIYKGVLQPETVPATLTFHIPKRAGKPINVAYLAADNKLYLTQYTYRVGSEYGEVTFQLSTRNFQLEYRDPDLTMDGTLRKYQYTWPGDYAVNMATVLVQQPIDANQMEFTPPITVTTTSGDNLLYYKLDVGKLTQGQNFDLSLSYQKSTDTLTHDRQGVRPSGGLPGSMWSRSLPWALGILALLVIAAGVLLYWRLGHPQEGDIKRRRRATAPAGKAAAASEEGVYCHRCGRRASGGDVFCRSCGTKLKIVD